MLISSHRFLVSLLIVALLLTAAATLGATEVSMVEGELIVKTRAGTKAGDIALRYNLTILDSVAGESTYLVGYSSDRNLTRLRDSLRLDPSVQEVQGNGVVQLPEINQISQGFPDENAPVFVRGESPMSFYDQPADYSIGIDSAQDLATGENVVVAVIDNGIDFSHPLMASMNVLPGRDVVDNDWDPSEEPGEMHGHGSFVTGLVALTAPGCTILPIRAFDSDGVGSHFSIIKAVQWARVNEARIINMSFSTSASSGLLRAAINQAYASGAVMVASAGNDGQRVETFPAAYDKVIAVTSFDTLEVRADFANFGSYIDLCAPGVNLYSCFAGEFDWGTWSGTSFSAPLVSGTVALVLDIDPNMSPAEIAEHLRLAARTRLLWGDVSVPSEEYGFGALDAYTSVVSLTIGDLDNSGVRDQFDLDLLITFLTGSGSGAGSAGGIGDVGDPNKAVPINLRQADINCDGSVDVVDIAAMTTCLPNGSEAFCRCYRR